MRSSRHTRRRARERGRAREKSRKKEKIICRALTLSVVGRVKRERDTFPGQQGGRTDCPRMTAGRASVPIRSPSREPTDRKALYRRPKSKSASGRDRAGVSPRCKSHANRGAKTSSPSPGTTILGPHSNLLSPTVRGAVSQVSLINDSQSGPADSPVRDG